MTDFPSTASPALVAAARETRSEAEARAEHERINADFAARMRWRQSPEGRAQAEAFRQFYLSEDERELERIAKVLIVGCAS